MKQNPNWIQFRISSFWDFFTPGSGESFPPQSQGSGDNSTCVQNILPNSFVIQRSVPVHGITQLGLRTHPTGSVTHEALTMTFSFVRSDKQVYHPTQAMAGPIFSHIWNPNPAFPGRVHDFHGCLYPGLGPPHGGFPDFGYLDPVRPQAPQFGAQGSNSGLQSLGFSITGPVMIASYDRYRQHQCCGLYPQTGWDSFPHLVTSCRGSVPMVPMATNSKYSHLGQTHSRLFKCDSRPTISDEPAHHNRVKSPPRNSEPNIWDVGNSSSGHVCHSPRYTFFPVYVYSFRASSTDDRCSVTRLAWQVNEHVSTIPPCSAKSFRTTQESQMILIAPWWPSQPWLPTVHNRDMSRAASHIICTHRGSHAALPSSRIFKRGL